MSISPPQGTIATSIADSVVETGDLQDDAVTAAKIADGAAGTAKVGDSAVTTGKLADSAVTAAKLADSAVTARKVAPSAVGKGQLAFSAADSEILAPSTVGTSRLADAGVSPAKLQEGSAYTVGGLALSGTTDFDDNATIGFRSSPSAVAAGDLSAGEIILDEATNRITWKDATGSAWAASATAAL